MNIHAMNGYTENKQPSESCTDCLTHITWKEQWLYQSKDGLISSGRIKRIPENSPALVDILSLILVEI